MTALYLNHRITIGQLFVLEKLWKPPWRENKNVKSLSNLHLVESHNKNRGISQNLFNYFDNLGLERSASMGGSPGLVVMGRDSHSKGRGFDSRRRILDGHFSHFTNKRKRGRGWPIFFKKSNASKSIYVYSKKYRYNETDKQVVSHLLFFIVLDSKPWDVTYFIRQLNKHYRKGVACQCPLLLSNIFQCLIGK